MLILEVRGPFFFSAMRSEQFQTSYPVVPPATFFGALDFTLISIGKQELSERVFSLFKDGRIKFGYAFDSPIGKAPLIRRVIKDLKNVDPKNPAKVMDALGREYTIFYRYFIILKPSDGEAGAALEELKKILLSVSVPRMGDTESLSSTRVVDSLPEGTVGPVFLGEERREGTPVSLPLYGFRVEGSKGRRAKSSEEGFGIGKYALIKERVRKNDDFKVVVLPLKHKIIRGYIVLDPKGE